MGFFLSVYNKSKHLLRATRSEAEQSRSQKLIPTVMNGTSVKTLSQKLLIFRLGDAGKNANF